MLKSTKDPSIYLQLFLDRLNPED